MVNYLSDLTIVVLWLTNSFRYGRLSVRRVDLVGDYAGQELFLVEGDSLLLRSFSDADLDFDRKWQKKNPQDDSSSGKLISEFQ